MIKTKLLAGLVLAALAFAPAACVGNKSASASADPSAPAPSMTEPKGTQVAAVSDDPNDPIVCQKEADSTTRIRKYKKTCMKKSEWDARANKDQEDFEDSRNVQTQRPGGN